MGLQMDEEVADYGPDRARDVTPDAPRRGGVIYRNPLPAPVDEIVEHAPTDAEMAAALAEAEAAARRQEEER